MGAEGSGSGGGTGSNGMKGRLGDTVGEGDFEQPLMMGVLQAVTEMARDVAELRQAVVRSYEGPTNWSYVQSGKACQQSYFEQANKIKGNGISMGPVRNWTAVGVVTAFLQDNTRSKDEKAQMRALLRGRVLESYTDPATGGQKEKVVLAKAQKMGELICFCQVTAGVRKSYVNVMCQDSEAGSAMKKLLDAALLNEGSRQYDTAPLKPIHRDLRSALQTAKGRGRGSR